jgi:hypothetical protein
MKLESMHQDHVMSRSGWTAAGLFVLALFVILSIEWIRQEFAIIKYWTEKQREGYRQRKRKRRFK